jgi:O-antigen ligase
METQEGQTEAERQMLISAAGSTEGRRELLVGSLKLTIQHPLLGVGPGQFAPYMASQAKINRVHTLWVGTHNTFTQVSSEVGIPALCFYVAVLASSIRALRGIYRRARRIPGEQARDIATMALALHTSFMVYCVCALFNHMAYEMTMPLMAAVTVAMRRTAPDELSRLEDAERRPEGAPESFLPVLPDRTRAAVG